jgi:hypothetical protein
MVLGSLEQGVEILVSANLQVSMTNSLLLVPDHSSDSKSSQVPLMDMSSPLMLLEMHDGLQQVAEIIGLSQVM